uniref:Uncharacterized protein n=1 Tax=Oryzias melastigma TaxID=30732 RepID=A0A3B3BGC3_ORYME
MLRLEGLHHAAGRPDGQAERTAALTHHQQRANVCRPDLSVPPRTLGLHRQTAVTPPLAAPHRAISKGGWNVTQFRLVELLVDTLAPVLEDDGDLTGNTKDVRSSALIHGGVTKNICGTSLLKVKLQKV